MPSQLIRTTPEELRPFAKAEVSFFLEKIPSVLRQNGGQSSFVQFIKLFSLYNDGILNMAEFFTLLEDLKAPEPNP
jgi:histone deacetylase complex regulatory component SIN3